jgi:hypothetical protein
MTAASPLRVQLRSIGIVGPGMTGWDEARVALADPSRWQSRPTVIPAPQRLPPAERRRAGEIIKLSLAVAEQACAAAAADPATLATVFSASTGDGNNCHALCEVLAGTDRLISPTRFTNSVHNASGGYWHIATASQAPSTSLCAYDASFGAGLLEAAVQCVADQRPVLLVAADAGYPEPMHSARPIMDAFGVALLLEPVSDAPAIADLELQFDAGDVTRCADQALEALRSGVPAARCLPLLQALAQGTPTALAIEYLDPGSLQVRLSPRAA